MKRTTLCLILLCAAATLPRNDQWKKVEEAVNKGLPKTAIEQLEPIIQSALANKAWAEAIRAISLKIALEGNIQGNKPEEKILRMQAALENAPVEMKPIMHAILAHWYWHYFIHNRWRLLQRTQTAEPPGADIQTWDLPRILAEIDKHFSAALADETTLKTLPISDFDALLTKGSAPDRYRPTLFDFLAHEALQFYQAGEHGAVKAEDEFELDATSPIFADAAEFIAWRPTADESSPTYKALRLYQKLLEFHQNDPDRSAFYDADLSRLIFGHNKAVGENKHERYKTALQRFIDATAKHEISARALATLAKRLQQEGALLKARELAQRGLDAFPNTAGGAMCFNLIQQIEAKSARLDTERVWNHPWPTINITYRNITKVYFRAVATDFDDYIKRARWGFGGLDDKQRKQLLAATPALEWDADLHPTGDYKERTEKLPVPTTLKPGFYFIIASHDKNFTAKENHVSIAPVWISDLALVIQLRNDDKPHNGFVLKANSGEPVAGATVRFWQRDREGWFKPTRHTRSDSDGRFEIPSANQSLILLAEHNGHAISTLHELWPQSRPQPPETNTRTVFFTDRALYRPGQNIHYKGICLKFNPDTATYETIANQTVTVTLRDPNDQEIARTEHTTNDYGSFSGSFTAPRDRLTGRMTICAEAPAGIAQINVEEYKRPKFQVELAPPAEAPKLGTPVALTGKATAYTGVPITGAKVKWRVERGVQLPYWCWWWRPPPVKAIAHGTAFTEPDGTFKIQFTAEPDCAIPAKNEPVFVFTISADVTDTTGETRSDQRILRAGYTALQASLAANNWQTPDKPVIFTVETKSLDGDPQPATGTVTIFALKQPPKVERAPLQRQH
ncbi:MAG: MG2 domain-containing protein, partial [Verrucomicrobiae bacterium]|nr:MG2 domain-containing protein [Verrucomicrobiae bacterium]